MDGDPGHVKGLVVRQFLSWYVGREGEAAAQAMLERMPAAEREQIDLRQKKGFGILPTRWYSANFVNAMLDAAIEPFDPSTLTSLADEAAVVIINSSISGIYKALFRMVATPDRLIKYQQLLWNQHYDSGVVSTEKLSETSHRTVIRDWRGHHHFSCRLNSGATAPIYGNMGIGDIRLQRHACISRGDDACVNVISWTK